MRKLVCNTSPLQYLHQIGLLHLLPKLSDGVIVPQAVADELAAGRRSAGVPFDERAWAAAWRDRHRDWFSAAGGAIRFR